MSKYEPDSITKQISMHIFIMYTMYKALPPQGDRHMCTEIKSPLHITKIADKQKGGKGSQEVGGKVMLERGGTELCSGTKETAVWEVSRSRQRGLVSSASASPFTLTTVEAAAAPSTASASSPYLRIRRRRSLHFCAILARTFTGFTPKRRLIFALGKEREKK